MAAPRKRKATGPPVALDTILLGYSPAVFAGEVVPASWLDQNGVEQPTDFARLADLGLVADAPDGSEPAGPAEGSGPVGEST